MHCVADKLGQLVMGGLTVTLCYNLVRIWVSGLEFSKTATVPILSHCRVISVIFFVHSTLTSFLRGLFSL